MQLVNGQKIGLSNATLTKPGTIFLGVALAVSLVLAVLILRSFWSSIILAIVIGIGFYPFYRKIETAVHRRNLSALLSVLAVLVILLVPVVFFASVASDEIVNAAQRIRANPDLLAELKNPTERALGWISKHVDVEKTGIRDAIDSLPAKASQTMLSVATNVVAGLAGFVGQAVITLFVLFFVFRDGVATTRWVASLLPVQQERVEHLFQSIRDGVFANLVGIIAVAIVQGFLTGLGFAIVRLHSPILFGIAAAVFSLIPLVGTSLVWLPASIFLFATGHWIKGIFLLAWGVAVVGTADNVVRPLIIMQRLKLHPVILLFALLGGVQQFGFVGLFIGPLVMSVIWALIEILQEKSTAAASEAEHVGTR